jgi:PAP2 superfamily
VLVRKSDRAIDAHYWVTLVMVAGLAPVLRVAGLPVRFDWTQFFQDYWAFIVPECMIGGLILYLFGAPVTDSLGPLYERFSRQKLRFVLVLSMILILTLTLGIRSGLIASVAAIVLLEVKDRAEANHIGLWNMTLDLFWPTAYVFVGGVVISAYNEAIAALRYNGAGEYALRRWDSVLLGGHSVSGIAHWFIGRWPGSVPWMELIYFGAFAQTGGCVAFLALTKGRRRAMQYIGTVLIAFYVALACFYLWPATGPYASCANHFTAVPSGPSVYRLQQAVLAALERIRSAAPISTISPSYFVALPSMHLAETLIALWFLRRWKRLSILIIVYDILLVPAILLLENHYLVDLIAAVPVAVLAIAISGRDTPGRELGCT